jgi:acyl carrier protein
MGLDPLEICFRLEKRFGIRIRANSGIAFLTAGALCDFVWQMLQGVEPGIPDFMELSKQINDALPCFAAQHWWPPATSFESRMERGGLEESWRQFQRSLGLSLPPLVRCEETHKLRLSRGFRTEAGVALWIVQNHPERVTWHRKPSVTGPPRVAANISRDECWSGVRDTIAEVLATDPGQVTPDAHLIERFGDGVTNE